MRGQRVGEDGERPDGPPDGERPGDREGLTSTATPVSTSFEYDMDMSEMEFPEGNYEDYQYSEVYEPEMMYTMDEEAYEPEMMYTMDEEAKYDYPEPELYTMTSEDYEYDYDPEIAESGMAGGPEYMYGEEEKNMNDEEWEYSMYEENPD